MVNNESAGILRMFDTAFEHLLPSDIRLYPKNLAAEIDALNPRIYEFLNNGVYKSGFASTQQAYDEAVEGVFGMLDELEMMLSGHFVFGEHLTDTDIRLFVTLIRFDAAYYGLLRPTTNRSEIILVYLNIWNEFSIFRVYETRSTLTKAFYYPAVAACSDERALWPQSTRCLQLIPVRWPCCYRQQSR
jgi:glutathionyl-hydroquinone reductase